MASSLTPKQQNFCLAYLETGNASEAYRQAYDAEKMKADTIAKRAHELLADGKITGRLDELRQPAVEAAQVTLENHLHQLAELREAALAAEQYSAAITAEFHRGKAAGLYVERSEAVTRSYVVRVPIKAETVEQWATRLGSTPLPESGELIRLYKSGGRKGKKLQRFYHSCVNACRELAAKHGRKDWRDSAEAALSAIEAVREAREAPRGDALSGATISHLMRNMDEANRRVEALLLSTMHNALRSWAETGTFPARDSD